MNSYNKRSLKTLEITYLCFNAEPTPNDWNNVSWLNIRIIQHRYFLALPVCLTHFAADPVTGPPFYLPSKLTLAQLTEKLGCHEIEFFKFLLKLGHLQLANSNNRIRIISFKNGGLWCLRVPWWHRKALTQWPPFLNVIVLIQSKVYACW